MQAAKAKNLAVAVTRGDRANAEPATMRKRIGSTVYEVRVRFNPDAKETMEDKILRLIRNDGLANQPECGIMELPQMSRPSERSA